jgi:hypothetical protein
MNKIALSICSLIMAIGAFGQPKSPVNWNYEVKKKTADTYDIVITASIDPHWHLYSKNTGKGGPIPTTITTKTNPLVSKVGALKELGKAEKVFDKLFNTNVISGTIHTNGESEKWR